jgi:hypothetical protein
VRVISRRVFLAAGVALALAACDAAPTPFAPASDRPTLIYFYAPG